MTVTLLRAFDGHAAGTAYTGTPEVEADLLRNGNAVEGTRNAAPAPEAPEAEQAPEEAKPKASKAKSAPVA